MFSIPQPIGAGDRIRVAAPSGAFDRQRFASGIGILEAQGLMPVFDDGLFARHRYFAGDDARRLGELMAALSDAEAAGLWTARGGYGAARLLPDFPVDSVRSAAMWLIGFSDATALHGLWARAGVVSVHGPNVTTLADWGEGARSRLFSILAGEPQGSYQGQVLVAGSEVRGPLLGGNLTVLASMAGTGTLPSFEGAVVLLEDVGERPYRLDRSLSQLIMAGVFEGALGFVIGQLTDCHEPGNNSVDPCTVIAETLAPLQCPVVAGFPFGHEPVAWPVPLGLDASLDGQSGALLTGLM